MKKLKLIPLIVGAAFILGGCAAKVTTPYVPAAPQNLSAKTASGEYVKKVDNFLVVMDSSSSMQWPYQVGTKFEVAKGLVGAMNGTLPELDWQSGLRVFGPRNLVKGQDDNALVYGVTRHATAGFGAALSKVTEPDGVTPLSVSLASAGDDLAKTQGKIALIVFSDGEVAHQPGGEAAVLDAAAGLKKRFGDRICIYPVWVGDSAEGWKLMQDLAKVTNCGAATGGEHLLTATGMTAFVTNVFLKPGEPKAAPATRAISVAPQYETISKTLKVEFDFDKAKIRRADYQELDDFAKFVDNDKAIAAVVIHGHTDNIGTKAYNRKLSQRRANSVVRYLEKHGVPGRLLSAKGHGFSQPIAPNNTKKGRQINRRVEAEVSKEIRK